MKKEYCHENTKAQRLNKVTEKISCLSALVANK